MSMPGADHYRLNAAPLRQVDLWLAGYEQFWRDHLAALGILLDDEGH